MYTPPNAPRWKLSKACANARNFVRSLWRPYAGVALFLFGNKRDTSGDIQLADGMQEEFRIAADKGLFVVPVGGTGSMAAKLHKKVLDNFDEYYPSSGYRRMFEALGRPGTSSQVTLRIVQLLQKLRGDRALFGT